MKTMSVRLAAEQHATLARLARLQGNSVNAEVRAAINEYIAARRRDPKFQERLREHRAEQNAVYDRLAS